MKGLEALPVLKANFENGTIRRRTFRASRWSDLLGLFGAGEFVPKRLIMSGETYHALERQRREGYNSSIDDGVLVLSHNRDELLRGHMGRLRECNIIVNRFLATELRIENGDVLFEEERK